MKIAVIGTGYVGLVVGTGLAENGNHVTCVDRETAIVEALRNGNPPIYEPGVEELVVRNMEEERLRFTTSLSDAIANCLLVFICVETPSLPNGEADVSAVMQAVHEISETMPGYRIIVNKSTCPVGTTERIRMYLSEHTKHPFDVVANPEFLKEGAAVDDFMRPDRIVVGCEDIRVLEIMKELYAPFLRTGKPFISMSLRSAEMTKYAVNTMLAARISMINELASICAATGADISEVREGMMADSRLGSTYLFPGLGYGGSCIPKDVVACSQLARNVGVPSPMLDATHAVNEYQRQSFLQTILDYYGDAIGQKRIAIWGASFKPRTDDIRNAPILPVIDELLEKGCAVAVYDPVADERLRKRYGDRITVAPKQYAALEHADGLVIATEWREFHVPDFERIAAMMREKVIFDGRNLYSPKSLAEHGFRYYCIGRAPA